METSFYIKALRMAHWG